MLDRIPFQFKPITVQHMNQLSISTIRYIRASLNFDLSYSISCRIFYSDYLADIIGSYTDHSFETNLMSARYLDPGRVIYIRFRPSSLNTLN